MRLFRCQNCAQRVHFENTRCERCGSALGYLPEIGLMSALEATDESLLAAALRDAGLEPGPAPAEQVWHALLRPGQRFRRCDNAGIGLCNWLLPEDDPWRLCLACRHNRLVPNARNPDALARWQQLERAKHRLFYALLRLQLPLVTRTECPDGLAFDFPADSPRGPRVMTGHSNGLITIALREADDLEREKMRTLMGEPYRTLLGHLRHETGHYFWNRLVRDENRLDECRAVFGDDRASYVAALERHYAEGPPADWQEHHISAYATMHPWEDFAESWAHYLHIVDTLDTANAYGLEVHPRHDPDPLWNVRIDFDPYRERDFGRIIGHWLPLSSAVNSLNRSMGQPDLYPFVLPPPAVAKLRFIHAMIHDRHGRDAAAQQ